MSVTIARSNRRAERLSPSERRAARLPRWRRVLPVLALLAFIAGWEAVVRLGGYPAFLLPSPGLVAQKALRVLVDGTLLYHTGVTLVEVTLGLALGVSLATVLGYALAKSITLEQALSPYLVASQAVPVIAIAPLLVLWFGHGLFSKVLISALIVFFPVLVNTIAGVRGVPTDLRDLMRSLRATPWQMFAKLEVPAALPVLLAGLKVGATLSVIGAVVGEFAGSDAGLGFMTSVARGQYDAARMFVGVFALIVMALALYGSVALIERRALAWRK